MLLGRELYKKASTSLRAAIWVFGTEQLGQLLRGLQPSTFGYIGASHGAGVKTGWTVCHIYQPACTQTFLGTL